MATTPATGGERFITVDPSADAGDAAGGELHKSQSNEQQQREMSADMARRKLKWVDSIVFCIAFFEWAGNAVGTLASLWATVVLLGGFCSMLSPKDFWFSTVMVFVEATRVFIRNDASINQWLFGSTRAFRWADFSFRPMLVTPIRANIFALTIGMFVSAVPEFRPKIVKSVIEVVLLVIISQMLSRLRGRVGLVLLILPAMATFVAFNYGLFKGGGVAAQWRILKEDFSRPQGVGLLIAWEVGTGILALLAFVISIRCALLHKAGALIPLKVITALALACLPFFQEVLDSYYSNFCITVSALLLILSTPVLPLPFLVERRFFLIVDTIMPILFYWSVMFPLPGISLKLSFYMLLSAIAAVLIGNLQIPVAFLQVLLSIPRLCSLLGHHHHDYHPLPDGASPNMVPSIVIFFVLELCQGSSYMIASLLGLFSLLFPRSLARASGLKEEWGAKAVNLYFRQAYQARTEMGLFLLGKEKDTPGLATLAIESLACTSSNESQTVALRILDNCLQRGDSKSNKKLIIEIVKDAENIICKIIGNTSYLTDEEKSIGTRQNEKAHQNKVVRCFMTKLERCINYFIGWERSAEYTKKKIKTEQKEVVCLSLKLVKRLATNGGKISTRFRHDLSENPFFLDSLEHILNLRDCHEELWELVMDIISMLALDEAARQEIGGAQSIIPKLIQAFLIPDGPSLRMAAGKALANLTIMSTDNCWAILLADPEHNLIKNLINMLEDEDYICVAANVLHNFCVNSRDKLMDIDFGANVHLESALPKVMEIIRTNEGKLLEAALCVASQIGYIIPGYFSQMLKPDTDIDAAAELVQKLVNTLRCIRKPCLEYPRRRRVLIEAVISVMDLCPGYIKIFSENGVKDALDIVRGTPSRLEKYRVFIDGEGLVAESVPMRDLVDKAKMLIHQATPAPAA